MSVALDKQVPLLLTQSFSDLRDECYALIDKSFPNINHLPKNITVYASTKLFAQFCLLSEELKKWLLRVRTLASTRDVNCLSRSEAYMNQNYLECIESRDVDLNRLRSMANQLLVMSGKTSDPITDLPVQSVEYFPEVNISCQLHEIETLWSDITSFVRPMSIFNDPARTIKDVELDLQETEAKLGSVSRRTFRLQAVLTKSMRGTCDLNSEIDVLKAEHISLKRSMQTLSAASCLLLQLRVFSVENKLHSYLGETFDFLIFKLTENIDKLTSRGWSLWIMHLELCERWKYIFKNRSSFEIELNGPSLPMQHSPSFVSTNQTTNNLFLPISSISRSHSGSSFTSTPSTNSCHPVSYSKFNSNLWITPTEHCQLNVEVNNHDSPSSTYSLCCSESGFSSDADHFLTCQATDQFDLSNPNFVISNLFNTKFQNAKSFSSVNHYIRSQSSSCLWTSSTGSNDSEAISDPPSGLFHGIYNRTPTKLVSSSVECNGKSGQNDKGKTNEYKYPAKQSKCTSDICFRRTSSLEDSGCNNSNIRSANHHNLGSPYSRFRSSDSGLKPGCSYGNRIQRRTTWSLDDISKMPIAIFSFKDCKHQFITTSGYPLTSPEQHNDRKLRRNSFTSVLPHVHDHSNLNTINLRETRNHRLDDNIFSELLPTIECESNSYSSNPEKSSNTSSIIIAANNLNNNHINNGEDDAEDLETSKKFSCIHEDNGLMYGIDADLAEKSFNIHRDNDNTDLLEWDNSDDLRLTDVPNSSLVNEADILPLLTSIRWDALPLITLLSRLEEKSVTGLLDLDLKVNENLCSERLEDERRQLDIDKSYLTHYGKLLSQWTNTMDNLLDSFPSEETDYKTQLRTPLSIALTTFYDWLSSLKARHSMAFWVVNWRSSMFDHLIGESHDANISLLGMKQRVQTAIYRAQEILKPLPQSYDEFTSSTTGDTDHCLNEVQSDLGVIPIQSPNEFLDTLDELRNLSENLWNIQSRLGSCYLFNDFWKFSRESNILVEHNKQDTFDYYSKELDADVLKCAITDSINFSCQLRKQIVNVMRDLECGMVTKSNAVMIKTNRLSICHEKQRLVDTLNPFIVEEDKEVVDNTISLDNSIPIDNICVDVAVNHVHSRSSLGSVHFTQCSQTDLHNLPNFMTGIDRRPFRRYFLVFLLLCIVFTLFEWLFGERSVASFMSPGSGCHGDGPVVELSTSRLVKYFTCFQLPNSNNVVW